MAPDNELLARWLKTGSEPAFAELVQRHLAMVHSAALRVVHGDRHLADDVAQTVFADLARKARGLTDRPSLAGWLHTSARFAAMGLLRGEHRRRQREEEALSMTPETAPETPAWSELLPVIDAAIGDLSAKDREALLLRYFENRSHREIGELLGLTDNAARMRVDRALDKVRGLLAQRGVTSTTSGLAAAMLAHGAFVTSTVTAAQITATALATATAAGSGFTLLHLMTATQLKTGLAVTALVAGISVPLAWQHRANGELRTTNAAMAQELARVAALEEENRRLRSIAVDHAELEALRLEHAELQKLRQEVDRLKGINLQLAERAEAASDRLETKLQQEIEQQEKEAEKAKAIAKMDCTKLLVLLATFYANDHGGRTPSALSDIAELIQADMDKGEDSQLRTLASQQGVQPDQFEFVMIGNIDTVKNPGEAILLRERAPSRTREGRWAKAYAFVDGHSEVAVRDTLVEFQAFEAERVAVQVEP